MQERENAFDLQIRSIIGDAEEAVPSGAWEAVADRLDKAARRRTVLRRWGIGLAVAAAAAALGIFLWNGTGNSNGSIITGQTNAFAVAEHPGAAQGADAAVHDRDGLPIVGRETPAAASPVVRRVQAVPREVVPPAVLDAAAGEDPLPGTVPEETAAPAPVPAPAGPTPSVTEPSAPQAVEDFSDDAGMLARLAAEEARPQRKVSLYLGGDVSSNGHPTSGLTGFRRAQGTTVTLRRDEFRELSTESTYGIPVSLGIGARWSLSDRWSVGAGVSYSLLTRSFRGLYWDSEGTRHPVGGEGGDIRNYQHYIGIPVNLYYDILSGRDVKFYASVGGTVERNIADRYRFSAADGGMSFTQGVQGMQLSAGAGLGVEFRLVDRLGLYVDPSVRYYFDNKQPKSIRTQQPLMVNLEVGLRVGF